MFTAVIIDDEPDALEMLEWQLKNYCPQVNIVGLCRSADEGIAAIKTHSPQLVFLDIEMPHKNGFEVIRAFTNPSFDIVFTTAYNQFAVQAFKVAALDYLMKPIDADDLVKTINRFENKQKINNLEHRLAILMQELTLKKTPPAKVHLPTQESILLVNASDIIRCESKGNYSIVFLINGKKITLSKTLKDLEELLQQQPFLRIHHSHLVNKEHITKYIKSDGGMVEMTDGSKVGISRQRKDEFARFFTGQ